MYLFLFLVLIIVSSIIAFIAYYKKNAHTELYREGLRNENDGQFAKALQNYEDALSEIRKLKLDNKFGIRISGRIKILRTYIEYEKNFHPSKPMPRATALK